MDAQELVEDNQIITQIENGKTASAFCEPIIEAKPIEHRFKFKIVRDSGGGNISIGIDEVAGSYQGYSLDLRFKRLYYLANKTVQQTNGY